MLISTYIIELSTEGLDAAPERLKPSQEEQSPTPLTHPLISSHIPKGKSFYETTHLSQLWR